MKDNKSGWQFPKALEIIKCKEGNKEFMKERPARRPFGNTVLICEFSLSEKERREREARDRFTFTEPEQCSLNVDPDTGEVVEESEVADE